MAEYDKNNTIIVFKNREKGENDKRPHMVGTLYVDNVEYKVSLWARETKNGAKYLSGLVKVNDYNSHGTNMAKKENEEGVAQKQTQQSSDNSSGFPF